MTHLTIQSLDTGHWISRGFPREVNEMLSRWLAKWCFLRPPQLECMDQTIYIYMALFPRLQNNRASLLFLVYVPSRNQAPLAEEQSSAPR
jgi:hypothetical protein